MMASPGTGNRGDRRWGPSFVLGAIAAVLALVVLAFVGFAFALNNAFKGLGDIGIPEREHLAPVPIAAGACPYLRHVRNKAESASKTYVRILQSQDRPADAKRWRTQAARHAHELKPFEVALRAAIPHVPAWVAVELRKVRVNVAAGRREVATARSASEYASVSAGHVMEGFFALNDASDLVGTACGFDVSPGLVSPTN